MLIASIQTATNTVTSVVITHLLTPLFLTIIKCNMYSFKDQPDDCNPGTFQKRLVNYSKRTKMVVASYATIISTVMERLSEQK